MAQVWSLGRTLLLFGGIVPVLIGLGTFLVPLQIGAPAMAFARGAAGALWTWLLATALLVLSYVLNGGPGGGRVDFVVLWAVALGAVLASLLWAMVILATTVFAARTQGMTLDRVPHTTWSFFVFSLIGIFSLPVLMAELVIVYVQVRHGFLPLGERSVLTGVMESVSLPPAVYWVGVPVLGMTADIVGVHTGRPVPAHKPLMAAVGLFGIVVYGADFLGFASFRPVAYDHALLVIAIALCVLPVLAVIGLCGLNLRSGVLRLNASLIAVLAAGALLLVATIAALLALGEPVALFVENEITDSIDTTRLLILNGTTFHDGIRAVVMGSTIVALAAALHHWSPKLWGRRQNGQLTMVAVLAGSAGALLWGLGAILAGVDDQIAYPAATLVGGENVEFFNLVAVVGMILVAVAAVVIAVNTLGGALGKVEGDGGASWSGATLEWATASPPAFGNFEQPPVVHSAAPLLDETDEAADEGASQ
jgi:heme/copper-type cytochrome/quinol oxidase subunit 1